MFRTPKANTTTTTMPRNPPRPRRSASLPRSEDGEESKPLPDPSTDGAQQQQQSPKRPGTSGTEMALKVSRRKASEKFRQAERAERAYRAKKRSAATRANYGDAKDHFKQAREHFGLGVRLLTAVVKGWPYVLREKREARRLRGEEEKRRKVLEMKRRLDEKLGEGETGEGSGKEEDVKVV